MAQSPMTARTTLIEPWLTIATGFAIHELLLNRQQSGQFLPLGSPMAPHSGVTPKIGHGALAWVTAASSGKVFAFTLAGWCFPFKVLVEITSEDDSA